MKTTATPKNVRNRKTVATTDVSPDDIALRAFEFYRERGGQPGSELDDWLRAERELMAAGVLPSKPRRGGKESQTA